jgi:hypothetical protein
LAQNLVSHLLERGGSERLRVEICIVELAKTLAGFDLYEGDLLFDVIEYYHQEMLAFLRIARIVVC